MQVTEKSSILARESYKTPHLNPLVLRGEESTSGAPWLFDARMFNTAPAHLPLLAQRGEGRGEELFLPSLPYPALHPFGILPKNSLAFAAICSGVQSC